MKNIRLPEAPAPATNAELIVAIDGYRQEMATHFDKTDANLRYLKESLEARLSSVQ